jgi:hypothetical protein
MELFCYGCKLLLALLENALSLLNPLLGRHGSVGCISSSSDCLLCSLSQGLARLLSRRGPLFGGGFRGNGFHHCGFSLLNCPACCCERAPGRL